MSLFGYRGILEIMGMKIGNDHQNSPYIFSCMFDILYLYLQLNNMFGTMSNTL